MCELSAGVYNLLKITKNRPASVGQLMNKVEDSDEHLEANLCTMLQGVCGTKPACYILAYYSLI